MQTPVHLKTPEIACKWVTLPTARILYIYNINYIFIIYNLPYVQYHMCSIPGMIVRSCRPHGLASRCAVWKFLLALRGISPASVLGSDSVS